MANQFPSQFPDKPELAAALKKVASRWGWFVGVGILLLILGVIASLHIFMAAVVSVWFIGLLMIFGGVAQLIHAWRTGPWTSFILWSLSGLLYLAGGVIALDRKSTRLNSSHVAISYAVLCLKKKKKTVCDALT